MAAREVSAVSAAPHQRFRVAVSQRHDLDARIIETADRSTVRGEQHRLASRQNLWPAVSEIAALTVEFGKRSRRAATDGNSE